MNGQSSLFLSLNFEGDELPTKITVVPAGPTVAGRDGRVWKNANPAKVAAASNRRLPLLPIDINHATDLSAPKGGDSPACGWFKSLSAEADGSIRAEVEWNEIGRDALLAKKYRYISPVFNHNAAGEINCVLRAALTNSPNLDLPALNSDNRTFENNENHTEEKMKGQLLAVLGLPETATDEEIVAAIKTLKEKNASAPTDDKTALQTENLRAALNAANEKAAAAEKQVAEINAAAFRKEVEDTVAGAIAAGKFVPANRENLVGLCSTREGLDAFVKIAEATPAIVDGKVQAPAAPPPDSKTALCAEETEFAKSAGYSEDEWKKLKEASK